MKYDLQIEKEKAAYRFCRLFSKDAPYLLDSYFCKINQKWYTLRRKNKLPEIMTLVLSSIGMLLVIAAGALLGELLGKLLFDKHSFYGVGASWIVSVFVFLMLYRWLPTVWISKVIGIEAKECDEQQAQAHHEQYLEAIQDLEKKNQPNTELIIILAVSLVVILLIGVVILLSLLASQGRL